MAQETSATSLGLFCVFLVIWHCICPLRLLFLSCPRYHPPHCRPPRCTALYSSPVPSVLVLSSLSPLLYGAIFVACAFRFCPVLVVRGCIRRLHLPFLSRPHHPPRRELPLPFWSCGVVVCLCLRPCHHLVWLSLLSVVILWLSLLSSSVICLCPLVPIIVVVIIIVCLLVIGVSAVLSKCFCRRGSLSFLSLHPPHLRPHCLHHASCSLPPREQLLTTVQCGWPLSSLPRHRP